MTTIVTSRFGLVIDQIVSLLQASPTFADPVRVLDGPSPIDSEWHAAVIVGGDGDAQGTFEAATITQSPGYSGSTSKFEEIVVHCAAIAWSGDTTVKTNRDQALLLLGGVETMLRTQPFGPNYGPQLGIDSGTIAILDIGVVHQEPGPFGQQCRILFDIKVQTQLLTT